MKGSICAVLAATAVAVSCKKQETVNPSLVTSTVEVMLGNPTTKAFGDGTTETWEKTVNNVTMYVYETSGTDKDVCVYHHQFTAFEVAQGKAVFTIENIKANTDYDFYALANCASTKLEGPLTRPQLEAEIEGVDGSTSPYGALGAYNDTDFSKVVGAAHRNDGDNKGFLMTGKETKRTPAAGANIPTRVTVPLKRTVAKVAIKAALTDVFYAANKYPAQSTLTITKVELVNLAKKTTLMPSTNPIIDLRQDPLMQKTNVVAKGAGKYDQFQNLFYIYENGVLGGALADANKPVLKLYAEFDFDGQPGTVPNDVSKFVYTIKLAGEAGDVTDPTAANFGLFVRNGNYIIDVKINGLTETEVVAEIKVMDWEGPKYQTVHIGD